MEIEDQGIGIPQNEYHKIFHLTEGLSMEDGARKFQQIAEKKHGKLYVQLNFPRAFYKYADYFRFFMFDLYGICAECILLYVKTAL